MIVVIGQTIPRATPTGVVAGGLASAIAMSAAAAGSAVQIVGRVRDDPDGDAMLLALAAAGVGHVATLRQAAGPAVPVLQPADLDLALRYLADLGVLVMTDGTDATLVAVAADAAAWSGAPLIVIVPPDRSTPADLPADSTVLVAPSADPDGAFAMVVGAFAAALDRGDDPAVAFREVMAASPSWTATGKD